MSNQNHAGGWLPGVASSPVEQQLQDICENRRMSFLEVWKSSKIPPMTYTDSHLNPEKIEVYNHPKDGEMHKGRVTALKEISMDHAVVVIHDYPDLLSSHALWVNQKSKKYREAYALFLAEIHGFREDLTVAKIGYDVDHLRSYNRTPNGTYIRVEACPSFSNRHWGSTYESTSTKDLFKPYRPRGVADWMTVAKLAGVRPPSDWQDEAGIQRILDLKNHLGMEDDEDLTKHLITDEFMRAYLPRKKDKELLDKARAHLDRNPISAHVVPWRD